MWKNSEKIVSDKLPTTIINYIATTDRIVQQQSCIKYNIIYIGIAVKADVRRE